MKFLLILFTVLPISVFSQEDLDCEKQPVPELSAMAKALAIPNCYTFQRIAIASKGKLDSLCSVCKDKFLQFPIDNNGPQIIPDSEIKTLKQKQFFDISFQEFKKGMTQNIVEVAKLRALNSTQSSFTKSIKSCEFKNSKNDLFKNCQPNAKKHLTLGLQELQHRLAAEVGQILSPTKQKIRNNGLLDRNIASNKCEYMPEKDILRITNAALEESLSEDFYNLISKINPASFNSLDELIRSLGNSEIDGMRDYILAHPLLSMHSSTPKDFIDFIKTIDPKNTTGLRKSLYSKDYGDKYDEKLADSCDKSYESLAAAICNEDFEKSNFKFNPFKHLEKIGGDISEEDSEYADTVAVVNKNINAFNLCKVAQSEGSVDGEEKLQSISEHLKPDVAKEPFNRFASNKYDAEVTKNSNKICELLTSANKSGSCTGTKLECSILDKYKNLKLKGSTEYNLANSSNEEINSLLRSMIGKPEKISAETRTILVAQGILPKENGQFVEQPKVAERLPDYTPSLASNLKKAPMASATAQGQSQKTAKGALESVSEEINPTFVGPRNNTQATEVDMNMDDMADMDSINSEIMRRLSDRPNSKQPSKEEVRKVTREVYKERKRPLTSSQEASLADQITSDFSSRDVSGRNFDSDRSRLDEVVSEKEKWAKEQDLAALSGMQGAQASAQAGSAAAGSGAATAASRSPASTDETQDKEAAKALSTVALNIAEDKVKLNLSEILNDKISKNDSEAQMLKVLLQNKKDFILQLNNSSFKILYNQPSKSFIVVFDKGDANEAKHLTQQLENFFNKVK